jgi:hypothetical protein
VKSRIAGSFILPSTGKASDRIPAYERGRVCEAWGCATILSKYNASHFCAVHERVDTRRRSA